MLNRQAFRRMASYRRMKAQQDGREVGATQLVDRRKEALNSFQVTASAHDCPCVRPPTNLHTLARSQASSQRNTESNVSVSGSVPELSGIEDGYGESPFPAACLVPGSPPSESCVSLLSRQRVRMATWKWMTRSRPEVAQTASRPPRAAKPPTGRSSTWCFPRGTSPTG